MFYSKAGEYKSVFQNQGVDPDLTKKYPNSGGHIDTQKKILTVFLLSNRQTGTIDPN